MTHHELTDRCLCGHAYGEHQHPNGNCPSYGIRPNGRRYHAGFSTAETFTHEKGERP